MGLRTHIDIPCSAGPKGAGKSLAMKLKATELAKDSNTAVILVHVDNAENVSGFEYRRMVAEECFYKPLTTALAKLPFFERFGIGTCLSSPVSLLSCVTTSHFPLLQKRPGSPIRFSPLNERRCGLHERASRCICSLMNSRGCSQGEKMWSSALCFSF